MLNMKDIDLSIMRSRATGLLDRFVIEILQKKKWITKSFSHKPRFLSDTDEKTSYFLLARLIYKEYLKISPYFKILGVGDKRLVDHEILNDRISFRVKFPSEQVLFRYVRVLNRRMDRVGLPGYLMINNNSFFRGWDNYAGTSWDVNFKYPYTTMAVAREPDMTMHFSNPYKWLLHLDDIVKVLTTIQKYSVVLNEPSLTLSSLYKTQRSIIQEIKKEVAQTGKKEALVAKKSAIKKVPRYINEPIPAPPLQDHHQGTTPTLTPLGFTTGTTATTPTATQFITTQFITTTGTVHPYMPTS